MTTADKMVTTVRKTTKTPAWARTVEGIVRRWEKHHDNPRTLDVLRLDDRLQRLFMIGCYRSARLEDEVRSYRGNNPIRNALVAGERLADGEKPARYLLDSLSELISRMTKQAGYAKLMALHLAARLVMPAHRSMGSRQGRVETDVAIAELLAALGGVHALEERNKMRRSERPDSTRSRKRFAAAAERAERTRQSQLLAGVVGPAWHLAPEWRTDTAVLLARGIYEERAFDRMPFLADALQDAGCHDDAWLARMRDPNWPWCRGCHVLDTLV